MSRKPNPNKKEKVKNLKKFIEDPSLITIANKVIDDNKLDYLEQVRIKYVLIDMYISKTCVAKCIRASKELKHFGNLDYIIEISKDVWDKIDDVTRETVLLHELLHILLKMNKSGDLDTKILDHDIKDFSLIIKKYGVDWFKEFKIVVSSIRDLEPESIDNIKV